MNAGVDCRHNFKIGYGERGIGGYPQQAIMSPYAVRMGARSALRRIACPCGEPDRIEIMCGRNAGRQYPQASWSVGKGIRCIQCQGSGVALGGVGWVSSSELWYIYIYRIVTLAVNTSWKKEKPIG